MGFWEVDDEVEPIALLLSNLWELLLCYAQDCYAMLIDVDWVSVSVGVKTGGSRIGGPELCV